MKRTIGYALVLVAAFYSPASGQGETKMLAPSITVNGQGEAKGKPDMAQTTVGVVTEAKSATEAMEANNVAMQQLMTTLQQAGIEEKDIQTTGFNISPQYRQDPPPPQGRPSEAPRQPRIAGYQVENQVQINVRDLSKLGGLLEKLVQSGANRMNGIAFKFSKQEELTDRARRSAMDNARHAAQLYAEAAGVELGEVLLIREQGASMPMAYAGVAMEAFSARSAVPIAAGELTVSANITITYAIGGPATKN